MMRGLPLRRLAGTFSARASTSIPGVSSTTIVGSQTLFFLRRNAVSTTLANEEPETVVFPREEPGYSYGLNWALATKGVIVNSRAFRNLKHSELELKGATVAESISGIPIFVKGNVSGEVVEVTKAQFNKILKQVTGHLSSISDIFVHDGAVGSFSKCDGKVRVISDSPSAALSLSNLLWRTPTRAISHDSCPITAYVATSISPATGDIVGINVKGGNGFIAADVESLSLVFCGRAFADVNATKAALAMLSGHVMSARGGLPLPAGLLVFGDSVVLLLGPDYILRSCSDSLLSMDAHVVLSPQGVAPFFQIKDPTTPNLLKLPSKIALVTSDSSGVIPSVSELSCGQTAFHFLAGYDDGRFVPGYRQDPSSINQLELSKTFYSLLKDSQISSILINSIVGGKKRTGKEVIDLVRAALSKDPPPFNPKGTGEDLQKRMQSFLLGKFQQLPQEFSF